MVLSEVLARQIVNSACRYVHTRYDWNNFNCVHFVREVYANVGISLPKLKKELLPPDKFHLSAEEFDAMPIGHSVFFKRILNPLPRSWTHIAIIISSTEFIHCSRRLGMVAITPRVEFLETYAFVPEPPQ